MNKPMTQEAWNEKWDLVGHHLECTACRRKQRPSDASVPFPHWGACPAKTEADQLPWRELEVILRRSLLV